MSAAWNVFRESDMNDRRSEPRMLDCELVVVSWQEGAETRERIGNVNDVSLGGVGVKLDYPIPVGTSVTVSYNSLFDNPLTGVVQHRSESPGGYHLGIEFVGDRESISVHYHPELFTSIR